MGNDVDVKIGLSVSGDASGAKVVENALKQVAGSVKDLGSAGSDGKIEATDSSITGLVESLSGLSRENAKGAVDGLASAILGITGGNVQQGLAGLSRALFGLTSAIPIPGVAIAASAALSGLAIVFKDMWPASDDATASLNDFGETLDEEMARVKQWEAVKVEWQNIIGANQRLRDDFETTQKAADSTLAAITKVLDAKTGSQVSSLRAQAAEAEKSGDKTRADELNAAAERVEQRAELVKLNLTQMATKDKIDRQTELLDQQRENLSEAQKKSDAISAELKRIVQAIESKGNLLDITSDENRRNSEVKSAKEKAAEYERSASLITGSDGPIGKRVPTEEDYKRSSDLLIMADELRSYAEALMKYDDAVKSDAKAKEDLKKEVETTKSVEDSSKNILRDLNAQKTSADLAAKDISATVGPSVTQSAASQAAALYEASRKEIEDAGAAIGPAIAKIAEGASAEIDRLTTDADTLGKQYADVFGKIYNAFTDGGDISAFQTQAQQIYDALELLGRAGGLLSPSEYVQSLTDSAAQIKSAMEAEAAAASAVKEQIVQIASGTKESMTASAKQLSDAGAVLVGLGSLFGSAVNSLAEAVTAASRTAERALAVANRASTSSELAMSQIRNMPR